MTGYQSHEQKNPQYPNPAGDIEEKRTRQGTGECYVGEYQEANSEQKRFGITRVFGKPSETQKVAKTLEELKREEQERERYLDVMRTRQKGQVLADRVPRAELDDRSIISHI